MSSSVIRLADRRAGAGAAAVESDAGVARVPPLAHAAAALRTNQTASDRVMSEHGIGNAFSPYDRSTVQTIVGPEPSRGEVGGGGSYDDTSRVCSIARTFTQCLRGVDESPCLAKYRLGSRCAHGRGDCLVARHRRVPGGDSASPALPSPPHGAADRLQYEPRRGGVPRRLAVWRRGIAAA